LILFKTLLKIPDKSGSQGKVLLAAVKSELINKRMAIRTAAPGAVVNHGKTAGIGLL
jgi:hypothetical protein